LKISVIVPAFNEERLLPASLRSICAAMPAFAEAGWESELIVCDNNSTDRTAEIAAAAGAIVVFEPVNQIARARNAGAARATGDWLVFVDADSFPTIELFREVVEQIRSGAVVAGSTTLVVDTRRLAARAIVGLWNVTSRIARWGAGSFIFCEAKTFRQIGGFSRELYAAEEIALFRRLKRAARQSGRRIAILHRHPLCTSGRKAQLYTLGDAVRFYWRLIRTGGRSLRSPEDAFPWYDGRR
jgi:glycosyltransferase involved in cell wall biosynthesis